MTHVTAYGMALGLY